MPWWRPSTARSPVTQVTEVRDAPDLSFRCALPVGQASRAGRPLRKSAHA